MIQKAIFIVNDPKTNTNRNNIGVSLIINSKIWIIISGIPDTPTNAEWLGKALPLGARIGFDPMIMPYRKWKTLQQDLDKYGHALVPVPSNLVDKIWDDQPPPPSNLVVPLEQKFTGTES